MEVPDNVEDEKIEEKVIEMLQKIEANGSIQDIEACHRDGKSKNNSKKTIIRFINRKYVKKVLLNRKDFNSIQDGVEGGGGPPTSFPQSVLQT